MAKKYVKENVYERAKKRVAYLFGEFDNVLVAFSGGKDSGVCLNLCLDYAKQNGLLGKLAVYHMDYEAQYQATTDYVERTFASLEGVRRYWLCLPIDAQCVCRMDGGTWKPWEKAKKDIWVRPMPCHPYVVNEDNCPFDYDGSDYEVQDRFCRWFEQSHGKTAVVIGIRTDESLNRFRAIASDHAKKYKGKAWINGNKAYPIYDWAVEDDWVYNGKFGKDYNRLYDLFWQAGLSLDQMRVASPFNDQAASSLKLYRAIDPKNWGKMVGRVNGVNFTAMYGGTTAMGWKSITKPAGFTWKEYCYFLLSTLDEKTRNHYLEKLEASKKSWIVGGAVDEKTIEELKAEGAPAIYTGKTNNRGKKDKEVVQFADYLDDTNVTDFKRIPTYKRMCICILKNDWYCKYMGFAQTKGEIERRKRALERYKGL